MGGVLYATGYGKLSAVEVRPIEIKPLFHYWPNSLALTYSNYGCNFYCPWCQNNHLSYARPPEQGEVTPLEELVELAILSGADGLSASFNEPATQFDYVVDATLLARERGLYSMVVTNMYYTESALRKLVEAGVDGFSADVKGCPGMTRALKGVSHEVVFRNARAALDLGAHVEMVYLVVTNTNDSEDCYKWIVDKHLDLLGTDVPLHVNRYYPAHRWREPPTPLSKLMEIREYARRSGLNYVYVGNVGDPELETTRCPRCGKVLVRRSGYRVTYFNAVREEGKYKCPRCGLTIPIRGRYVP
ncbi:Radical SAM domain protein [Thermogladius calderae 1633]|uniref:Radical SAM domain protein n=1 Tax=Thermogladius calderae (strain DSM 22663 / VKM B-2946 / 1633) TaxID=1184251 RepID=I3TFJ9_THEC1|nr:radical SAM protein [Thermogladius calderae]AFK51537.1 Radical SAM domain protein [Thermogladius calderae 1633]